MEVVPYSGIGIMDIHSVWRSRDCNNVPGGLSYVVRRLVASWFDAPVCADTVGIVLSLPEPTVVIFRLSRVVADADAFRAMFSLKGTQGVRCCPPCRNVLKKGHAAVLRSVHKAYQLVDITCTEFDKFDLCEDSDWHDGQSYLKALKGSVTKGEFEALQIAMGQVYNDSSIVADDRMFVKPASMITLDWMHLLFVGGVQSRVCYLATSNEKGLKHQVRPHPHIRLCILGNNGLVVRAE